MPCTAHSEDVRDNESFRFAWQSERSSGRTWFSEVSTYLTIYVVVKSLAFAPMALRRTKPTPALFANVRLINRVL
jgi:hypothetical protein